MTAIDLTLELPDRLAREARAAGLLSARALSALLRAEIRRMAAGRLLAGAAQAGGAGSEPLPMADLQREIKAVRKSRRAAGTPAAA